MRLNSSGEHKAASNDRKYLLKILKTIDNIQTTIHQKLNRTASKDHYSRQSSSPTKNIHPQTLKISNKSKSLAKSLKNSDVFLRTQADCQQNLKERKYGYVLPLRNQKKDSQASFFQTPKKNQARDLKDNNFSMLNLAFDSPFDRCVFERSEITKKLSQTPKKLLLHEKQNDLSFLATEQKKNSSSLTQKRLVPKERAGKPEQRPLQKQDYSSGIERYYANQQQKLRLLEATNQLQELFEKCVIQKKYAGREQQLALRCKMESLSQRIAKIKHKQSHFINH